MRDRVLHWIEERRQAGAAIVLVTHQIEPFLATASRAVGLAHGSPVMVDPLPEDEAARREALENLARGGGETLQARELRPGLWRWTAAHPDWIPGKDKPGGWGRLVGSVLYEPSDPREPLVLFDPLVPAAGTPEEASFWKALDADVARRRSGVAVLLGNFWHDRSVEKVRQRYRGSGVVLWAHPGVRHRLGLELDGEAVEGAVLPAGIRAFPIAGLMASETIYWIPEHGAIVAADALIGAGRDSQGRARVRVPPSWWADEDAEGQGRYREELRPQIRRLLDLPIEMVLVSHGEPVLEDGARVLREGLEAPAWGE